MLTPKRGLNTSVSLFVGSSFRPVVEKSKAEACTEFDADAGGMADAVVIEDKPMNIATATVVMRAMFLLSNAGPLQISQHRASLLTTPTKMKANAQTHQYYKDFHTQMKIFKLQAFKRYIPQDPSIAPSAPPAGLMPPTSKLPASLK